MSEASLSGVVLWAVVATRLLVPLAIPRLPLPGVIAALVLDGIDQTVFQVVIGGDLPGYQIYDKALDVHYLTIAYLSTIRNWSHGWAFEVARALWYYRLVGVVLFEATDERWLLLVFPNTFEYYFIAIEAIKVGWNPFQLSRRAVTGLAAAIWIFIKLPQEWWIHVAKLDMTDLIADVVADQPLLIGAALVVGVALLVVLLRLARQLPPRHWQPTLSADAQRASMGWAPAPATISPRAAFDATFVEKVVLITFVATIFAEILPGADRNVGQVGVAVVAIVALSTLVSQLLARRGVTWSSAVTQLVATGAVNVAVVVVLSVVLPFEGAERPVVATLFLVALLTLIVVLYDRFTKTAR